MAVSASAPLRFDLTGGYTDIAEIYARMGGAALNVAISPRTVVHLVTPDLSASHNGSPGLVYRPDRGSELFVERLLFHVDRLVGRRESTAISVRSKGPMGCGLGSSASLAVAVVGLASPHLSRWEVVDLAHMAEVEAGNECGVQDEVAAAYGGFNAIELPRTASYRPPSTDPHNVRVIASHFSLWLTGAPRFSGDLVNGVLQSMRQGDRATNEALNRLNAAYPFLKSALLDADVTQLIDGVKEVHAAQVTLGGNVVPRSVRELIAVLEKRFGGAAKVQGGGGPGAALLVVMSGGSTSGLRQLMIQRGYSPLRFKIEDSGVSMLEDRSPMEFEEGSA